MVAPKVWAGKAIVCSELSGLLWEPVSSPGDKDLACEASGESKGSIRTIQVTLKFTTNVKPLLCWYIAID